MNVCGSTDNNLHFSKQNTDTKYILLPLHIKVDLMKNFVKAMNQEGQLLKRQFSGFKL